MVLSLARELPPSSSMHSFSFYSTFSSNPSPNFSFFFIRTSDFSLLRSLPHSLSTTHHHNRFLRPFTLSPPSLTKPRRLTCLSASVDLLASETTTPEEFPGSFTGIDIEGFSFDKSYAAADFKHLKTPELEVKDLDELPEQWRRARLAWLCKELPAYKAGTLVRILNAQKKWMRQEDATYVVVHCMRIRENEAGFKVSLPTCSLSMAA